MKSVVEDKGSFTVEASIIAIFIVAVIINIIVLIFHTYDMCLIHEEVNSNMFFINKKLEKMDQDNNDILKVYNEGGLRSKLICTSIVDVVYSIEQDELKVSVIYKTKVNRMIMLGNAFKDNESITRTMKLFNIKKYVRKNGKVC